MSKHIIMFFATENTFRNDSVLLHTLTEGGIRVCGGAVLSYFWCGFAVIFILTCGIAVLRH